MSLGLSLIITLALFCILNFILKSHSSFLNGILAFWWAIGGLYWGLNALGWEYFDENEEMSLLFLLFYGLFWIIVTIALIGFQLAFSDVTPKQAKAQGSNVSKILKRCPKCTKKIPSYFTTKCPHCTADI
jgi:hypothetical protein